MKTLFPRMALCLFLSAACVAQAGIPAMNVTVSDASGKAAFKGATKSDGAFATNKLQPGPYVVQFTAKNSDVKGGRYFLVIAAGSKKVVANAVAGEKFLAGGVAMKLEVGSGLNITGQVATKPIDTTAQRDSFRRMQDQDGHREGMNPPINQTQDKMIRP